MIHDGVGLLAWADYDENDDADKKKEDYDDDGGKLK